MRINKFIASCTGMSRRAADKVILEARVTINGKQPEIGQEVTSNDVVLLDKKPVQPEHTQTIIFHKPRGYITSRNGQGSSTIYDILPTGLQKLKPVGRLDKDSSGLLILTNDGKLAHALTHPSFEKIKIYEVTLDKPLQPLHRQMISDYGIQLEDGLSKFELERLKEGDDATWRITMHEGRNRQIRRTFAALGYRVRKLHRTHFGSYTLGDLKSGSFRNR